MNEWAKLKFLFVLVSPFNIWFLFPNVLLSLVQPYYFSSWLRFIFLAKKTLTTQTTPNLWPANSATWVRSARSQMRTEGWCPHSPVTMYLPSAEKATAVNVLRDTLTRWVWRFLRGLNSTIEHLQGRAVKDKREKRALIYNSKPTKGVLAVIRVIPVHPSLESIQYRVCTRQGF